MFFGRGFKEGVSNKLTSAKYVAYQAAKRSRLMLAGRLVPTRPANVTTVELQRRNGGGWAPHSRLVPRFDGTPVENVARVEERRRRAQSIRRALGMRPKQYRY